MLFIDDWGAAGTCERPAFELGCGLLFYFPALNALMAKDGVTLGQFGIFLLLSYASDTWLTLSRTSLC